MRLGDLCFQRVDGFRLCLGLRFGHAGQAEEVCDVRLILDAHVLEPVIIDQIIIAVRHAEAALAHISRIFGVVLQVLLDADCDGRPDAKADRLTKGAGEIAAGFDGVDLRQFRLLVEVCCFRTPNEVGLFYLLLVQLDALNLKMVQLQ